MNVGNLTILEKGLNEDCENNDFKERISVYKKSKYLTTKTFLNKYSEYENLPIEIRANEMGNEIYKLITSKW